MRHEGDERGRRIEPGQIADDPVASGEAYFGAVDFAVRALEKALQYSKLVENFHGRGMDRVAAEIAKEIGVFLEHQDAASGAREQQAGHHPRWPSTDDDRVVIARRRPAPSSL